MRIAPSLFALAVSLTLAAAASAQNCSNTSIGLTPLNDLGTGTYQGYQGGLYPAGSNARPIAHEVGGLAAAAAIVPRDAAGNQSATGKIVFLSIGMSNCVSDWSAFRTLANADALKNPRTQIVQGAQGGQPASAIDDPNAPYWGYVMQQLQNASATAEQVQAVFYYEADPGPTSGFPTYAQTLQSESTTIMQILLDKFPNLRQVFVGSREYAGYAVSNLNPEPYAYEQGFANKWMIEAQIDGDPALNYDPALGLVEAPWIAWGAYMWADGLVPRSDGLVWQCTDFNSDGTHPSQQGANKYAQGLLAFVHADSAARQWYLTAPPPALYGTGKTTSVSSVASIGFSGTPSLAIDDFMITLAGGVPQKFALAFYSGLPHNQPFLGGTLYVKPPHVRLPVQQLDASGAASYAIPIDATLVGLSRDYQFWGRDPQNPDGTGVFLSNALQVLFGN